VSVILGQAGSKIGRTIEIEAAIGKRQLPEYAIAHILHYVDNPDYTENTMVRVSAAEIQKQFGAYSETAQREPVTITKHGRDSLVLISAEAYERLKSLDTRKAYHVWDLPDDIVEAMERELERLEAEESVHRAAE
jgi:prevent-host-death family protein